VYRAEKRERFLLGVAAGAVLAAILVIPLAIALNNRLGSEVSADTQPPDQVQASPTFDPAAAAEGETLFASCVACHGPDAKGIAGLGKTLIESDFVNGSDDAELVAFLKVGRSTSDPANTTGVDMPPKGGNPALSDEDLGFIVAYIRSLS
jgi:disulfide bond formation protein DsbB